tara:strand:+ start:379 stop:987 length:609 start_codon:yes stop_codon:yes gene_type:complete
MTTSTTARYYFPENFFDKPLCPQEIANLKRELPSIKCRIRHLSIRDNDTHLEESKLIVVAKKKTIADLKADIELGKTFPNFSNPHIWATTEAPVMLQKVRDILALQQLTVKQFKKKATLLAYIYNGNKVEAEKRLTPYKESLGDCFEYYEEHSKTMGIIIEEGTDDTENYIGEENLDENIRRIAETLQKESNIVENYFKICC